jgi:hypothetical protein
MNIFEMIKEGLRIARTSKSLWLYGFFVGLGATVNRGSNGHLPGAPAVAHVAPHASSGATALLGIAIVVLIAAAVFMYFVSEGALIEGVTRVRRAEPPTLREGWRDGLAHWGVLLRITVIYFATSAASIAVLATPYLLALKLSGTTAAVVLAIPAVLIAVPWLATLYMWQAFAARIAVIENRHARDAIGKARLFLHGRLLHGLKLIIAAILGRLIVLIVGLVGLLAAAACVFGVLKVLGMTPAAFAHAAGPAIALAALVLLPIVFILVAISGTTQSSIWTIGYLTQEQK